MLDDVGGLIRLPQLRPLLARTVNKQLEEAKG